MLTAARYCYARTQTPHTITVGAFSHLRNRGVEMPTQSLERRLASARDKLCAARRDGCEADLAMWLEELDALLDEYLQSDEVWSDA